MKNFILQLGVSPDIYERWKSILKSKNLRVFGAGAVMNELNTKLFTELITDIMEGTAHPRYMNIYHSITEDESRKFVKKER